MTDKPNTNKPKKEGMSAGELIAKSGGINALKGCVINIKIPGSNCKSR